MNVLRQIVARFSWVYFLVQDPIIAFVARRIRGQNQARTTWDGADPLSASGRIAVYVHFDPDGLVHDYVVHQLRALVSAGYRTTFVSNAPIFPDASQVRVAPFSRNTIWRFNVGYDFGAYKDGIDSIADLDAIESLILMNDSTYGPFRPLSDILSGIDRRADFWGIVDSWEQKYHIQSFFLVFRQNILRSAAFKTFWQRLPYINNKGWIIRNAEIGLSQTMARANMRGGALASYWSVADHMKTRVADIATDTFDGQDQLFVRRLRTNLLCGRPLNAMHFFWDVLITDYRCPFIKRELIKLNPARVPWVSRWPDIIASVSEYDTAMIDDHLRPKANKDASADGVIKGG